ncbi:MAG TPA: hypothetical protein VIW67_11245 [Terriglobales bacterium]|jgi:hypothetical protein
MKCEEIQEYLSALCDGERIPSEAAEHIGSCEACRARMNEYLKIGVELRRLASVELTEEVQSGAWQQAHRRTSTLWEKGWETMRIPRFAFALLLISIVALSSGMLMSKARAQGKGTVLMLTFKLPDGTVNRCALSLVDEKNNVCEFVSSRFLLGLKALSHSDDQVELGVGAKYMPAAATRTISSEDIQKIEEQQYWFRPGENLEIDVPGWGKMTLAGELTDHMPPFPMIPGVQMDPKPDTLQIISPLLLQDKKVLLDLEGAMSTDMKAIQIYSPGKGRWILSLSLLTGAVEARVNLNRVSFEENGHSYTLLMGAPVTRSEQHVWVLHEPTYQFPGARPGFVGGLMGPFLPNKEQSN